jgi:hypothetical protein
MITFRNREELINTECARSSTIDTYRKEMLDFIGRFLEETRTPPKIGNYSEVIGGPVYLVQFERELSDVQLDLKDDVNITHGFSYEYCKARMKGYGADNIDCTHSLVVVMPITNNEGGPLYFIPKEIFSDIRGSV